MLEGTPDRVGCGVFAVLMDEHRMNATEAARLYGKDIATITRWITPGCGGVGFSGGWRRTGTGVSG
jgi:hypothetical protein